MWGFGFGAGRLLKQHHGHQAQHAGHVPTVKTKSKPHKLLVIALIVLAVVIVVIAARGTHFPPPSHLQKPDMTCTITAYNACTGVPNSGGSYTYPTNDVPEVTIPG